MFIREQIYLGGYKLCIKWVEAITLPQNDRRSVHFHKKSIFTRFGTPRAIISDGGSHFYNQVFTSLLSKGLGTRWKHLIIPKQMEKLKSPIRKLRIFWPRS